MRFQTISFPLVALAAACALPACTASVQANLGTSSGDDGGAGDGSSTVEILPDGGTGAGDDGGSSGGDDGGAFVQAQHAAFPQIVYANGGLLTAPKVVTATFPGDTNAATYATYGAGIATSSWWDAVRAGYCESGGSTCVGQGPQGTAVTFGAAPAASYTDSAVGGAATLQTFLAGEIGKTLPTPDANTLYVIYMPASTTVTLDGDASCQAFDGYHNQMTVNGKLVAYAIVNECPAQGSQTQLQANTITSSHEVIESATDPFSTNTTGGYYLDLNDPSTFGWNDLGGGEVADMCVDFWGISQDRIVQGNVAYQRSWSNTSAAAGHDPCVPLLDTKPYFNAAPQKSFFVLDVGASTTFEVDAWSDAPRGDWLLLAQDITDPNTPYLQLTIAGATSGSSGQQLSVNNGSKVQVTMKLLADPGSTFAGEADAILVSSDGDPTKASSVHIWPIAVMSTADAADAGVSAHAPRRRPNARPMWRAAANRR